MIGWILSSAIATALWRDLERVGRLLALAVLYDLRDWRDAGAEHYRLIKGLVIGGALYKVALMLGIF